MVHCVICYNAILGSASLAELLHSSFRSLRPLYIYLSLAFPSNTRHSNESAFSYTGPGIWNRFGIFFLFCCCCFWSTMLKRHRWSLKLSAKNPRPVLRLFSSATGPAGIQIPLHQWCTGGYVRACVCVESAWGRVFKEIWDRLLSFTSLLRNDSYSYR